MNRLLLLKGILQKGCAAAILLLTLFSFSGSVVHFSRQKPIATTELAAKNCTTTKRRFFILNVSGSRVAHFFSPYIPFINPTIKAMSFTKFVTTKLLSVSNVVVSINTSIDFLRQTFAPRKSIEDSVFVLRG